MVKLTLKNYRPFSDREPLRMCVDDGITALIGPNNAGKSSLLRFFYELRSVWQWLINRAAVANISNGTPTAQINGVGDPLEIFHNGNDRPLSITFEFPDVAGKISKAEITLERPRTDGPRCQLRIFSQGNIEPLYPLSLVTAGSEGQAIEAVQGADARIVDVEPLVTLCRGLEKSVYFGAFRNAITESKASYFDLNIGTSFINEWHAMKTGTGRIQNQLAVRVEDDIRRIFGFDSLEINAAENNQALQVRVNRQPFKLRELGGGLAQFIVTYGNVAMKAPQFIFMDEPELNLHPSLQLDFLTSLASYAARGVLFATHSIGLARAASERIYSFRVESSSTVVRPFEETNTLAEFVGEMSFSAYRELGFDRILLVEGVTDVKTVQQFLRLLGRDHQVVLLPLGGDQLARGDVDTELLEVLRISRNVSALVDSERRSPDDSPVDRRLAFAKICEQLEIPVLITERRALENYVTDSAIKAAFGGKYHSLAEFESLRDATPAWSKSMTWRAAREMTKDELLATDVGRFLAAM